MQTIPHIYYCKHDTVKNLCQECRYIQGYICEHLFERQKCLLCNSNMLYKSNYPHTNDNDFFSEDISISDELFSTDTSMSEELSSDDDSSNSYSSYGTDSYFIERKSKLFTKTNHQGHKCNHGNYGSLCKMCRKLGIGGGSICEHLIKRSICLKCKRNGTGGGSFCDHEKLRSKCLECKLLGVGGRQLCLHYVYKAHCPQCRNNK